jgi:sarcosine oxidase
MTTSANHYAVIVIGVGGMGSATVYHLAKRGKRVLGLEQFDIPHSMGSSHGHTRIIRLAYAEEPRYVPLLRRAFTLWQETQQAFGEQLLYVTGHLDISREQDDVFSGSVRSCVEHDLRHEVLTAPELMRRFPAYQVTGDLMANYQPDGGFVLSDRGIVAHVMLAQGLGAEVHAREIVQTWEPISDGVKVITDRATYTADKLVITAGAWASKLIQPLAGNLAVPERQVMGWFQPHQPEHFALDKFPVWVMEVEEGVYYGFPVYETPGFKFGRMHHRYQTVDPNTVDRECYPEDEAVLRSFGEKYFPQGMGPTMALRTCMFTNTPDYHFILDVHPEYPQVVFAAGFSGHGYKFTPVIGEIMADLALKGKTSFDLDFLKLSRFLPEKSV